MAQKKSTNKTTAKKKTVSKPVKKPKVFITTKKVAVVNVKKTAVLAVFAWVMAYAFGSWAIDSGSLWMYLFTYVSVYYAVSYSWKLVSYYIKNK